MNANHAGHLDRTNNVKPTTAAVTRATDDDLEAIAAVALILDRLDRSAQRATREVTDLVLLLARCADWGRLNAETGYIAAGTARELHACYTRLRKGGVAHADIAGYIREGEGAYQRQVRVARGEVKARVPARGGTLARPQLPAGDAPRTLTVAVSGDSEAAADAA